MVTRRVARYAGTQAAVDGELPTNNQTASSVAPLSADELLRRAHATSIAGVIDQIAQVATHALAVFAELRTESDQLNERFRGLATRVNVVAAIVLDDDRTAVAQIPPPEVSDRVLHVPELSSLTSPRPLSSAMQTALDQCEPLPPFDVLAEFCADVTPYRKKYTNPEFFQEDWMQRETFRQQHEHEQRDERRRQRREQRKSLVPVNQVDESVESEKERQKLKFLNIRSWKERYGTGEGKELLKPPVPRDAHHMPTALTPKTRPSLTRKSKSFVKDVDEEIGIPATAAGGETDLKTAESPEAPPVRRASVVEAPPPSGAFMQEIEDPGDDLLELEDPLNVDVTTGDAMLSNQDAVVSGLFADHGLSYFDPNAPEFIPPPPTSPPPDDQGEDQHEEEDSWVGGSVPPPPPPPPPIQDMDDYPPPPPPPPPQQQEQSIVGERRRGSFVPPPPPPLSAARAPPPPTVTLRPPNFLNELQRMRSELRHIEDTALEEFAPPPPPPTLLSPRANLLEQIRTQRLRPVPARPPRASAPSLPILSAPFASSIARILERREMTAYDSDPSDKSDEDDDSDWK